MEGTDRKLDQRNTTESTIKINQAQCYVFNIGHDPPNLSYVEALYKTEFCITEILLGRTFCEVLLPKY